MVNYTNRYGDDHTFELLPNGNVKWTGNFEWCRFGWPNVYKDAYAQYVADGGTDNINRFKELVHEWDNQASAYTEFAKKYMHLVYSDTESIDMVDPSGGPYISVGMPLDWIDGLFKGKFVTQIINHPEGYELVCSHSAPGKAHDNDLLDTYYAPI